MRLRQARHQELQHHFGQVEASNFVLRRHWPLLVGQLLVQPPALAGGFAADGAGTLARFGETANERRFAKSASTTNQTPLMVAYGAAASAQPRPAAAPPTLGNQNKSRESIAKLKGTHNTLKETTAKP